MTGVISRTISVGRRLEVLVSVVLCASIGWCAVLVVRADDRSPRHSVLREPISWFASGEAPGADDLRLGLTVVGALFVVLAVAGVAAQRPRLPVALSAMAGALVVALARVPLDCSIRFDYCEKLVTAGFASDAHLTHVALSVVLVLLAALATVIHTRQARSAQSVAVALVVVVAVVGMLAAATWEFLGALQLVALIGGTWATARLWLTPPTLGSPP